MYNVTLTKEQLQTIQEATNLLLRVQLGQWPEIFQHLPIKEDCDSERLYRLKRSIAKALSEFMKEDVDGIFSSFGVGNSQLPKTNSIALDIHDTIRHKLSWENAIEKGLVNSENDNRMDNNLIGVNFDKPFQNSDQPLPIIERVDDSETV